MKCLICDHEGQEVFRNIIMGKYDIAYYQCPNCKLIYTEKPYWLYEAYQDAIADTDTGLIRRSIQCSVLLNTMIRKVCYLEGSFLDYGGGYGVFVRMMRDLGHQFKWYDKYCENVVAKGFEYNGERIELVTAFELFEHFEQPLQELERMIKISRNILLSTVVYNEEYGYPDKDWWYYAPYTGQHICFYHKKTFQYLAEKYHLNYYQIDRDIHFLTEKHISRWKIKILFGNKIGKIYQYFKWILDKKYALCELDAIKMCKN